jgi:hypothetical protein
MLDISSAAGQQWWFVPGADGAEQVTLGGGAVACAG